MTTFENYDLSTKIKSALAQIKFTQPTPIQQKSIPLILKGKDLLASSQTGTGKTAAFCIPIVDQIERQIHHTVLVLTPTRELAMQIHEVCKSLTQNNKKVRTGLFIGGVNIQKQISHLKSNPHLLIATPGRVMDLFERGVLRLNHISCLVLDETDRMLDMGFGDQIKKIVKHIPEDRQTLLFSATIPRQIEGMAKHYQKDPVRISMEVTSKPADNLIQEVQMVREVLKFETLAKQIESREGAIIVFTKTKRKADKVAKKLYEQGFAARSIHGDLSQNVRQRVLKQFRDQKCRILVATDVAARGLDITHVEHVINYDLPQSPQDYIHRIGRTARAGAKGKALSLVSPRDEGAWKTIERFLNSDGSESFEQNQKAKRNRRGGSGTRKNSRFRAAKSNNSKPKHKKKSQFKVSGKRSKNNETAGGKSKPKKSRFQKSKSKVKNTKATRGSKKTGRKPKRSPKSKPKTPWS